MVQKEVQGALLLRWANPTRALLAAHATAVLPAAPAAGSAGHTGTEAPTKTPQGPNICLLENQPHAKCMRCNAAARGIDKKSEPAGRALVGQRAQGQGQVFGV